VHDRTEEHPLGISRRGADRAQFVDPLAQIANPAIHLAQLLLAIDIFGVFRAIALGGRRRQCGDHLAPLDPQMLQLGLEQLQSGRGDIRAGTGSRRSPSAHSAT